MRRFRAVAGLSMIASLVIVQGLQGAAFRSCPHHSDIHHVGPEDGHHRAATAAADVADAMAPMPMTRLSAPEAPRPTHGSPHDSPCDCLGPCGASGTVQAPSAAGESVFAHVAPRRIPLADQRRFVSARWIQPFALPYPNAPPV